MNTIHRPNAHRPTGFYHQADLRPFSNRLAAYTVYARMLLDLRSKERSVRAMTRSLRKKIPLRRLRLQAQRELQSIYDHVAFGLALPKIPVRLPQRKRIHAAGFVRHLLEQPLDIRIFPICGCPEKPRRLWKPADLRVCSPSIICEILLHETAHVHQGSQTFRWDHEKTFVESYKIIEEIFLGFGFGPLLPHQLRFGGCPPGTEAARRQGTARQGG